MYYQILVVIFLSQGLFAATPHAGIFSTVRGNVFIQRSENKIFARMGDKVFEGDTILTERNSLAKVLYRNNSMIEVKASSNFLVAKVAHEEAKESIFSLIFGEIRAVVGKKAEDETFEIESGPANNRWKTSIEGSEVGVTKHWIRVISGQAYYFDIYQDNKVWITSDQVLEFDPRTGERMGEPRDMTEKEKSSIDNLHLRSESETAEATADPSEAPAITEEIANALTPELHEALDESKTNSIMAVIGGNVMTISTTTMDKSTTDAQTGLVIDSNPCGY